MKRFYLQNHPRTVEVKSQISGFLYFTLSGIERQESDDRADWPDFEEMEETPEGRFHILILSPEDYTQCR
jgi:hypothetical protein